MPRYPLSLTINALLDKAFPTCSKVPELGPAYVSTLNSPARTLTLSGPNSPAPSFPLNNKSSDFSVPDSYILSPI